jgi:hypothetical protein
LAEGGSGLSPLPFAAEESLLAEPPVSPSVAMHKQ